MFADFGCVVIVRARVGDRVVFLHETIDRKAAGGKEHRRIDLLFAHIGQTGGDIDLFEAADQSAQIRVQTVGRQQSAAALGMRLCEVFSNIGILFNDVAVGIDYVHDNSSSVDKRKVS